MKPHHDGITAPDVAEPIIGWRYWRFDRDCNRLASLTGQAEVWPVNQAFRAACRFATRDPSDIRYQFVGGFKRARHDAPEEECTCGIYAARDLRNLRGKMLFGLGLKVVGEVAMWGKVIPGPGGYRAQFAYPRRLYVVQRTADWDQSSTMRALGVYGVPVEAVAHQKVGTRPADVVAVALETLAENIFAFGEAIAGFFRRGRSPTGSHTHPHY